MLIEAKLASKSLGLHELMTEIDKRFIDCINHLMTRPEERREESMKEAKRIMHRYNGVMPKVFAATGEAFAEWARTCEAQACDTVSWLASARERSFVTKLYALWQQDRGPGGSTFTFRQWPPTSDQINFAVLVHQLVDLNYDKVSGFSGLSYWDEWTGDRNTMRLKSTRYAREQSLVELGRCTRDASSMLARNSMSQEWALPVHKVLTLFFDMWPKKEWAMSGEALGDFWTAMSSTQVMPEVEHAVSRAIKHVNAITAEVGTAGSSAVIARTHEDAVSRLEELVHVRAQLAELGIAVYTLFSFDTLCAPVFASDEQRSTAHRLACARAAGSAADPRDVEVVAGRQTFAVLQGHPSRQNSVAPVRAQQGWQAAV